MSKMIKRILWIAVFVVLAAGFLIFENNALTVTNFNISSAKLPKGAENYTIVQLSDLHSKSFGNGQQRLVSKVQTQHPNLIVITGDLVDSKRYDEETSLTLMKELTQLAPVYFVTGNHEWWSGRYEELEKKLELLGVHVLRNRSEMIQLGEGSFRIIGIDDPAIERMSYDEQDLVASELRSSLEGDEESKDFMLLLSHRPELFPVYEKYGMDLVLSGHAHGGQVRLPFIGGLVAPNQGFLPKYDAGQYTGEGTTMIVSRGLGNSIIPQRLFNRPEIVVIKLSHAA
ncbi:metallophosphoesterase [Paenibacillus pinihumi]|uniref:metallophosphoesterase n=1 Tax=Paenibacillus pinihumi TaxID=669462 RepID=UPI00042A49DD|nr:metallophosphoesterase [Paenibacillus pinihumi]